MQLYTVTDWNKLYENNRSRELVNLDWVPIPNKHDGERYSAIWTEPDGAKLFAAWILIIQVASKCGGVGTIPQEGATPCRGRGILLTSRGIPHTPKTLGLITRAPPAIFERAFEYFTNNGWLTVTENPALIPHNPAPPCGKVPIEEKGREGNGMEGRGASAPVLPFQSNEFKEAWSDFELHRREIKKPLKPTSTKMQLRELEGIGEQRAVVAIRHTIAKGWQGIREPEHGTNGSTANKHQRPSLTAEEHRKGFLHGTEFEHMENKQS